jgi:hypothetical protein
MGERREDFFRNERLHQRERTLLRERIALKDEAIWETVRRVVDHYLLTYPTKPSESNNHDRTEVR